jgi:peptide/nickel transport system substrate-binding protein
MNMKTVASVTFKGILMRNLILALLATATFGTTCALAAPPADTLVVASRVDELSTIDPAEAFEASSVPIVRSVYDTLFTFAPGSADVVPGLVDKWSLAEDGVTYSFEIKSGIKFHSGNELTAEDVEFSIERTILLN